MYKLLVWLAMIVLLFVLTQVCYVAYIHMTGNQSVMQLKMAQLVLSLAAFVVPALWAAWLWSPAPSSASQWLRLRAVSPEWLCLLVMLLMLVAQPGINLLATWNEQLQLPAFLAPLEAHLRDLEEAAKEMTDLLASAPTFGIFVVNLLVMALVPALGEELTFRGICLGLLEEKKQGQQQGPRTSLSWRTHLAIWVVGILFSLIHFQFYGFVPRMLLGVVFGYLVVWSGSLWLPILAHFTNNGLVVLFYYLEEQGIVNADSLDTFGTGTTAWVGAASIVLTGAMLWLVRETLKRRNS